MNNKVIDVTQYSNQVDNYDSIYNSLYLIGDNIVVPSTQVALLKGFLQYDSNRVVDCVYLIYKSVANVYADYSSLGKIEIRGAQYDIKPTGNLTTSYFLGVKIGAANNPEFKICHERMELFIPEFSKFYSTRNFSSQNESTQSIENFLLNNSLPVEIVSHFGNVGYGELDIEILSLDEAKVIKSQWALECSELL
jgi:hypothetical protein